MAISRAPLLLPILIILVYSVLPPTSQALLHQQQQSTTTPSASTATTLRYHNGDLLTFPVNVYLTWYGSFTLLYRSAIASFLTSFGRPSTGPTVSNWWATTRHYRDRAGKPASAAVTLVAEAFDSGYSMGKSLTRSNLANLVRSSISNGSFPLDTAGIYVVLTAADVEVERFCASTCGFHAMLHLAAGERAVVVAHVGDPSAQCPGLCAWPYAAPAYGPPAPPLVAPNGVGVDGVVMNIAIVIAGAVTNPSGDGFYQGDRLAPLEAATACAGVFGPGAYPGYPGDLMVDEKSKATFNAFGAGGRRFMLPALWEPVSGKCKVFP